MQHSYYCFPNKLEDIVVLGLYGGKILTDASYAYYYLGNLYYDKRQYDTAIGLWERSAELNPDFATIWTESFTGVL
ncbi:MAG: tetratricopeptide repeat protein [Enterocloster sp.]